MTEKREISTFAEHPLHISDLRRLPMDTQVGRMNLLDDKSVREMFSIIEMMKYLAPMYADDARLLWIEVLRGEPEEWMSFEEAKADDEDIVTREDYLKAWEDIYPDEVEWWAISSAYYQDMHYLTIHDGRWKKFRIGNRSNIESENNAYRYDCTTFLDKLWDYLHDIIDSIRKDPELYNSYIDKHLPPTKRTGTISTKEYRSILGCNSWEGCPEGTESFLTRKVEEGESVVPLDGPMTLRRYATIWSIAREGIKGEETPGIGDPLEVFSHSSKGYNLEKKYGLDSEDEFRRWCKENMPYHCYDLVYARVHLFPEWKDGRWHLDLSGELEGFSEDIVRAGMALEMGGIPFSLRNVAKDLLDDFRGDNRITFAPLGGFRSSIGTPSRQFPDRWDDDITTEQLEALVKATRWVPLKKARSVDDILQEDCD